MKGGGCRACSIVMFHGNLFYGEVFQEVKNVYTDFL